VNKTLFGAIVGIIIIIAVFAATHRDGSYKGPTYPGSVTLSINDSRLLKGKLNAWQEKFTAYQLGSEELQRDSIELLKLYKCDNCQINYNTMTLVRPPAPPVIKEPEVKK
jgi:hypothetical protein